LTTAPQQAPVVCAGEILIDLIANPGDTPLTASTFAIREGGAPMNAAIALARIGTPVRFCGAVGDDYFGQRLRQLVEREGVDATAIRTIAGESTSIAYAWRDDRGDGHFQLVRLADRLLSPADVESAGVDRASALLVGSVALAASPSREAILRAVEIAVANDVPVVFDVNVRPTIWSDLDALRSACEPILQAATVLKLSLDDAHHLWGAETAKQAAESAAPFAPRIIVITDGSRGVYLAGPEPGDVRHFPVFPVEAVDPTGAGDAFTAALFSRLRETGWNPPSDDDIRFAMAAGALATTRQGALTALPTRHELERFLAGQAIPS
jgi:fructokinase